jgi:ketosteroid isomerase-like protein
MSANVDLVRSIYAAREGRDSGPTEWADAKIEFVFADGPEPGRWTGVTGMRGAWRDFMSAWEDYRLVVDELRELDHERVLVLGHYTGRGKASGVELGQVGAEGASVYHLRDGKVTKIVGYFDQKHALADLGIAPEGATPAKRAVSE